MVFGRERETGLEDSGRRGITSRVDAFNKQQYANLRSWRTWPDKAVTLEAEMSRLAATVSRQKRSLGPASTAWLALCPPELLGATVLLACSRGVLTVQCADHAARYELDRWLRSGGELALVKRCPGALLRVKLLA